MDHLRNINRLPKKWDDGRFAAVKDKNSGPCPRPIKISFWNQYNVIFQQCHFYPSLSADPSTGDYLYCSPCVIPTATYAFWTASVLCFATLPFLVLRSYNVYCFTFVFLSASLTYCAIYNTATSIAKALPTLKKYKLNTDVLLAPGLSLGGKNLKHSGASFIERYWSIVPSVCR